MKRILKYLFLTVLSLGMAACFILAFTSGANSRESILCTGLEVVITDSLKNAFVTKNDVSSYIDKEYGKYIGVPINDIDLTKIEDIVDGRSAVLKSQAYVTKNGIMHVNVTQRRPVVRFQKKDGGFYADADGFIFPLQRSFSSHVHVVDGNIPLAANSGYKGVIEDPDEMQWFKDIMTIVNFIENSRTWKNKIVQISVNKDNDLILVPREGKEVFLFGQPEDVEEKFRKMEKYYTHVIPEMGQDSYKTIDLEYKGQIVCRK